MENWVALSPSELRAIADKQDNNTNIVFFYKILNTTFFFKEKPECREAFIKDITTYTCSAYTFVSMGYVFIGKEDYDVRPEFWVELDKEVIDGTAN